MGELGLPQMVIRVDFSAFVLAKRYDENSHAGTARWLNGKGSCCPRVAVPETR